jgi:hypothetical protein
MWKPASRRRRTLRSPAERHAVPLTADVPPSPPRAAWPRPVLLPSRPPMPRCRRHRPTSAPAPYRSRSGAGRAGRRPLRQRCTPVRQPHGQRPRPQWRTREADDLRVHRLRLPVHLPARRPARPVGQPARLDHDAFDASALQGGLPCLNQVAVVSRRNRLDPRRRRQHVQHGCAPPLVGPGTYVPGRQRQHVPHDQQRPDASRPVAPPAQATTLPAPALPRKTRRRTRR